MRPIHFRTISAGVLAVLAFVASAGAQQWAPELLAAPQVRALMASAEPADHAKLGAHFEALSTRYLAEANRNSAFARAYANNPRGSGLGASAHHNRLATLASESATVTRELATHHTRLAAGVASMPPKDGERFERGEGAPATPSEKQMLELASQAQTPSEHGLLGEYYTTLVARYNEQARDHRAMAQAYRGLSRPTQISAADHCERLVRAASDSAKEAQALADEHTRTATRR